MSSEITLLLTRGFGVQSINTSFDAEFASRPAQAECARGTGAHQKVRVRTTPPTPSRPPPGTPPGFLTGTECCQGGHLTLWSGVAAPPRALCELHSGPHVKKIVLRLRSKKAEISKRLWPRNRKNGKRIYSYYGLQTRYAVWRSRSH